MMNTFQVTQRAVHTVYWIEGGGGWGKTEKKCGDETCILNKSIIKCK
jgi:hypothetical protein